jgi:hypothetical protein
MERQHILAMIAATAVANGIFSPYLVVVLAFAPIWYPAWMPDDPSVLFMSASLILSTTTLLFAGAPAALIRRSWPSRIDDQAEMWLWFAFTVFLSLAALRRMLAMVFA